MMEKRQGSKVDERDFDAIEAAVMETERGRWFLAEFTRRNRLGETRLLLDAITRLEQNVGGPRPADEIAEVRATLGSIFHEITRAAAELGSPRETAAAFGAFVDASARAQAAGSDVHDAAERVSDAAWRLREAGASPALCGELENAAADISTACAFVGATARRGATLGTMAGEIARTLETLPAAWRPAPRREAAPARAERTKPVAAPVAAPVRDDVPRADRAPAARPRAAPASRPGPPPSERPYQPEAVRKPLPMPVPSLAALETMDFRERAKLFT